MQAKVDKYLSHGLCEWKKTTTTHHTRTEQKCRRADDTSALPVSLEPFCYASGEAQWERAGGQEQLCCPLLSPISWGKAGKSRAAHFF